MSHKHCVFCGVEVPCPRPTSFNMECDSPLNLTTGDTFGRRYHAVIVGSAKNETSQAGNTFSISAAPSPAQGTPEPPKNEFEIEKARQEIIIRAVDKCHPATDGERFCLYSIIDNATVEARALAGPQNGQGWVRVEERLPECGTVSIVYCVGEDGLPWQDLASYSYHGGWSEKDIEHANKVVTHWQPLPAPPTGDAPTEKKL